MHFIIGTAGHVDHGKTSLVRALTGIETDRLREEKERGLSIVPGFAHLTLPDGRVVGLVDVPGHERFLRNMLAGVSGVDIVLLVIAADEGVMPQTVEHLQVLELLRVRRGLIVLTKCDAVDEAWLGLAREDVRARLAGSFLAEAPLMEVSAKDGSGLTLLTEHVARICNELEAVTTPADDQPFRLDVDRVFTIEGFGTVLTGSATAGQVSVDAAMELWVPGHREALATRVRGIEVHGKPVRMAERGQRVALNVARAGAEGEFRGATLTFPGSAAASDAWYAWLWLPAGALRPIKDHAAVRLYVGTAECGATVQILDGHVMTPGSSGYVRLRLDEALPRAIGDRFVLREVATERVAGGGLLLFSGGKMARTAALERLPLLHRASEAQDAEALAQGLFEIEGAAGITPQRLSLLLRRRQCAGIVSSLESQGLLWQGKGHLLSAAVVAELKDLILSSLAAFHIRERLYIGLRRQELRAMLPAQLPILAFDAIVLELIQAGEVMVELGGAALRAAGHEVRLTDQEKAWRKSLEQSVFDARWQPPTIDELLAQHPRQAAFRQLLYALLEQRVLVRAGDFVLSPRRESEGAQLIADHLRLHKTMTVREACELLGTTRKWVVPLLEHYDRVGITSRSGDARIAGGLLRDD